MSTGSLGKLYKNGDLIICEGKEGHCMFVVQEGEVEVFLERDGREISLDVHGAGQFIGEMALFDRDVRSASVRAHGDARVLTIDKKNFMRRVHEDPSLAFRLVETMSHRIRELLNTITELEARLEACD